MSPKLFQVLLLPFAVCFLVCLASWVRQEGLEFPAGVAAVLAALPFIGLRS